MYVLQYRGSVLQCVEHKTGRKYGKTFICEHSSFQKHAGNPKHSYIKVNFPRRNNGNSVDSFHDPKIFI